ncbi:acyltransferase family protein [Clostridium perfringens]|uniref:acyltransferase family protein n=1 Tax=Clostridium perfringens TaxID=1502 RepID=UPI0018E4016B|nr:acyltransferase family protein [Clostridium perfringens]MBI6040143.1 acyltransferase family protein [Clostridium perfringens]
MKKELNKKFLLLQFFAILLVVNGHKFGINMFNDWFPIYSYHMALFIFISGYFYKSENERNVFKYIYKKFKNLIIPYYIWAAIYLGIVIILNKFNLPTYSAEINLKNFFIEPWITGHQLGLNVAAWFVLSLFCVQVFYVLFRKIFFVKNEWIIMVIFIVIGAITVLLANKGYNKGYQLTLVKLFFLVQFYQMGYLYKKKIEHKVKLNTILYFLIIFLIQFLIIKKWGNDNFSYSIAFGEKFSRTNIFLPLLTSTTGIMLWLKISEILLPVLGENKYIKYIAKNTWTIMMHHQLTFYFINLGVLFISTFIQIDNFNYDIFLHDMWYGYNCGDNRFYIFYIFLGIVIPLTIRCYLEKCVDKYRNKKIIKTI